jgi:hypothetical protein
MRISAAVVFIGHSTGQRHPAERINEHHNYQDEPDDTDASAASPSRISVIATASAEQEHCENNQQQHGIVLSASVGPNTICGQAQTKTVPICTRRFSRPHKHHYAAENRDHIQGRSNSARNKSLVCSVVAARAKVSPKLARGDMVQLHGATAPRFGAPLHSCRDFGLGGSAELIGLLRVKFIREKCYLDSQDVGG